MSASLGIDTGGTFTDFVLVEHETGMVRTAKTPSVPDDPARAIAAGFEQLPNLESVGHVIIGTTVATNAVIERRGPSVVFVTNRGFEDVPFIGRLDKERLYDLHWRKPRPLVRRRDSIGIGGRIGAHGEEVAPLSDGAVCYLIDRI